MQKTQSDLGTVKIDHVIVGEGGRMLREDQSLPNGVCKKEPDKIYCRLAASEREGFHENIEECYGGIR